MNTALQYFNHPVMFLFLVFLGVTAFRALFKALFNWLGWTGPAALV